VLDQRQAVRAIREANQKVPVTKLDAPHPADVGDDSFPDDAEVIEAGDSRLDTFHKPGRTPGSVSFHTRDTPLPFTGDTPFPGGPGNTTFDCGKIIRSVDATLGTERPHLNE
jgi:glyoxylase-like metal-dependent hydrolase (beta-lactamase superfamily II)